MRCLKKCFYVKIHWWWSLRTNCNGGLHYVVLIKYLKHGMMESIKHRCNFMQHAVRFSYLYLLMLLFLTNVSCTFALVLMHVTWQRVMKAVWSDFDEHRAVSVTFKAKDVKRKSKHVQNQLDQLKSMIHSVYLHL